MSDNPSIKQPGDSPPRRSALHFLKNVVIVSFFAAGLVVSAGSFGLFGCYCFEGVRMRENPVEKPPVVPLKGDMPPLPTAPK